MINLGLPMTDQDQEFVEVNLPQQDSSYLQSRAPLVFQDIKADSA